MRRENNLILYKKDPSQTGGIFYLQAFLCLLFFCIAFRSIGQAQLKFTDAKQTFETVQKGAVVNLDYEFTNTGTEPLIISEYKVECSCTSAEFPKQPIAPGKKSKVTVKFDTKTVWDWQDRTVEIISNAKNSPVKIRFKGNVKKPAN